LDAFGRLLLGQPDDKGLRRGLERARLAVGEEGRLLDARIDEARKALEDGEDERARALLEDVVDRGGDRDRALALLDRLPDRRVSVSSGPAAAWPATSIPPPPTGVAWSRRALVGAWALSFACLGGGMALSWERLVGNLVKAPVPSSPVGPATATEPVFPSERAVEEAQRLMKQGDPAAALKALDGIRPEEPSYPFARELRGQAETALKEQGTRR
jgi:hypothetical protein